MANRAAATLRAHLADPSKMLVCPGVQDGLSARVCLEQGFEALYMVVLIQRRYLSFTHTC